MKDGSDSKPHVEWFDDRSRTDPFGGMSRVETIPDADTETVTFAWRRSEDDETTTAWITADADIVVSGSDMQ